MDELALAQRSLARALGKARAGEDRELGQRVREGGEAAGQLLAGLLKMSRVHAADNRAFDAPAAELARALAGLGALLGPVHLVAVEDQVLVNEVRLRTEGHPGLAELGAELRRHNTGGITFHGALDERQLRRLAAALGGPAAEPHPRTALGDRLEAEGVSPLELHGIHRFRITDDAAGTAIDPAEALERMWRLTGEAWAALEAGRALHPLPIRRIVAHVVEIGPLSPRLWDAWVAGPSRRDHAVAVALHALLIADQAGLSRALQQDLGVAALVHDVGYAAMGGGGSLAGPDGLARHPGEGARALLRQRGFSDAKVRRLQGVLDHHRGQTEPRGRPSLVGSILRIAEDYAGYLRVYEGRVTATDVLAAMAGAAGAYYHADLVQLLVNGLGRYPPGTLLELADGRRVRAVSPVRDPDSFSAPLVREVDPDTGGLRGGLLDLLDGPAVRCAIPG